LIAQGIAPFSPESVAVRAGKLMLDEIEQFSQRGADFGFETTLSGRAHLNLIRSLKLRGYVVNIFYLWIPSVQVSLLRVQERVSGGGHNIPEPIIRRRFDRSIRNFLGLYRELADAWYLINNSNKMPSIIAFEEASNLRKIDGELFDRLVGKYGEE
jgi:predicted ABC-type ATPase